MNTSSLQSTRMTELLDRTYELPGELPANQWNAASQRSQRISSSIFSFHCTALHMIAITV